MVTKRGEYHLEICHPTFGSLVLVGTPACGGTVGPREGERGWGGTASAGASSG